MEIKALAITIPCQEKISEGEHVDLFFFPQCNHLHQLPHKHPHPGGPPPHTHIHCGDLTHAHTRTHAHTHTTHHTLVCTGPGVVGPREQTDSCAV